MLLVERIKPGEVKTKSGLIIADAKHLQVTAITADRPHWAIVLDVGAGFYDDETGEPVPLGVTPGDVVLLGQMSAKYFSTAEVIADYLGLDITYQPDSIGVVRESEVLIQAEGAAEAAPSGNQSAGPEMGQLDLPF
jgi:co-chaperonin GroES (HSP10)